MNKKSIEQRFQRAEALLGDDKPDEANRVLWETLQSSRYDRKVSQQILLFYIEQEMYEEALELFNNYRTETGEDLPSDFSVEDIRNWAEEKEKKRSQYAQQYIKVFKKNKSMKSNLFCFIREVNISDEYIDFVFRNRTDRYFWSTLSDSYITKKKTPRSPYSDTKDHVVFVFNRRKYKLRIDPVFEDLQDTNVFLKEIQKHGNLRIKKEKSNFLWLVVAVGTLILLFYLLVR